MFVKKDYLQYFQEIAKVEKEMIERASTMKKAFSKNPEALELIEHWQGEERNHMKIAQQLISIASKK